MFQKNQKEKVWKRKRAVKYASNSRSLLGKIWKGMQVVNYAWFFWQLCLLELHFPTRIESVSEIPQSSAPSKIDFANDSLKETSNCQPCLVKLIFAKSIFQRPWETYSILLLLLLLLLLLFLLLLLIIVLTFLKLDGHLGPLQYSTSNQSDCEHPLWKLWKCEIACKPSFIWQPFLGTQQAGNRT